MAEFMRKCDHSLKLYWDHALDNKAEILASEDFSPQLLGAWVDNVPSIWRLDESRCSLEDILAAVCMTLKPWENPEQKVAYLIFDEAAVSKAGLAGKMSQTNGKTQVPDIDTSGMHFEISGLTAKGLYSLMLAIIELGFRTGEIDMKALVRAYQKAFKATKFSKSVSSDGESRPVNAPIATADTKIAPAELTASSVVTLSPATSEPPKTLQIPNSASS